ncbi:hypothetical protein SMF913_14700 [Streptomyces malaysiensis]|uniref:Uncharacterized protein n=1 Tax=Streptomyces malaysiensis TaxID=92644 RepID=A0A2J7ZEJ4_STRMQ|nr:hypothetical protein SMF913_14700 [Streptomyces malaysiensis]
MTSRGSDVIVPPASVRGRAALGGGPAAEAPDPDDTRPLTHSGHWNPTEALIMHSGQIGRSQRVQVMPVSRWGCR